MTPFFTDDNTGWTAGTPTPTPQYDDFIANGSTRNYSAFSFGLAPDGSDLFSQTSYDFAFTDDSSNNSYQIQHYSYSPYSTTYNRILNTDLTTYYDATNNAYFTEDTTQPFVAGSTVTPNTF